MNLTILDTFTGESHKIENSPYDHEYWWADGNGSCDCNRLIFCGNEPDEDGYCILSKRFLITENSLGIPFDEINQHYPQELRDKYRPKQ